MNSPAYLERVKRIVMENLRHIGGPPSVQMQGKITWFRCSCVEGLTKRALDRPTMPIDALMDDLNRDEDEDDPNERRPQRLLDALIRPDGELSDSEDEGDGRRDHRSRRERGHSSDSEGKLKFGMGIGILASSSGITHGAGPSGHTTAVRVRSSSMPVDDEESTETPEEMLEMELEETPPSGHENGAVNGKPNAPTPSPSPPKEKEGESEMMMLDDTPEDATEPPASRPYSPPSAPDETPTAS
jgi:histone deacetylase 1/2